MPPNGAGSGHRNAQRSFGRQMWPLALTSIEPSLRRHRSLLSGNAILGGRDKGPEMALEFRSAACRDRTRVRIPAGSGLFATRREISVCIGMRGGPGRTRTSNQAVMSAVTAPESSAMIGVFKTRPLTFVHVWLRCFIGYLLVGCCQPNLRQRSVI